MEIRPKRSLTLLDVLAITRELRDLIVNCYIDRVYRYDSGLLIRIRKESEKLHLIATRHRIGLTRYVSEEERKRDAVLKNLIERVRIVDIHNPRIDRIVCIHLSNGTRLVFELIEPMNVVLVDQDERIRWCLHPYEGKDRKVRPGLKYMLPPRQFLDVLDCSPEAFLSQVSGQKFLKTAARVLGVGVELVREACAEEGIECDDVLDRDASLRVLQRVRDIIRRVLEGSLEPRIYARENKYITVTPIRFIIYEGFDELVFRTFNEAVDEYFRKLELEEAERSRVQEIEAELAKLRKSIEQTERMLQEYRSKAEELYRKANLVLQYKYMFEELVDMLNKLWQEDRDSFNEIVRNVQLYNLRVVDYNPRERTVTVLIEGENVTVALPLRGSVGQVISELFEKAKELKRKAESAERALEELRQRERELMQRRELVVEEFRKSIVEVEYGVHEWFEKFKWFITSGGHLVLAGKDASQNETLVRKYLREFDLFIHADIPGGAVVVLRLRSRDDAVSTEEIMQAAKYAASNSRAWIIGAHSIDVFYVRGEQVTKEAPAGEYLARGSFMIYGERQWIRGVTLELAIGIRIDNVEEGKKIVRILSSPPEVADRMMHYYVILRPGRIDKNRCASLLREKFLNYIRSRLGTSVRIRPEDIVVHIPGSSDVVEEGESARTFSWSEIREIAQY